MNNANDWWKPKPDDWQDLALCAQTDPDLFFPEKDDNAYEAKKICGRCPVAAPCLNYALQMRPRPEFGIWAGQTTRQIAHLRQLTRNHQRKTAS